MSEQKPETVVATHMRGCLSCRSLPETERVTYAVALLRQIRHVRERGLTLPAAAWPLGRPWVETPTPPNARRSTR